MGMTDESVHQIRILGPIIAELFATDTSGGKNSGAITGEFTDALPETHGFRGH